MNLDILDHIVNLTVIDFIDVALVATLLYYVYKLVKGTVAINIFIGIVMIYIIWKNYTLMSVNHNRLLSTFFL